jgi:hypothetical protein
MPRTTSRSKPAGGTPGKGKFHWEYPHRVCLHLLWTLEPLPSRGELARIFNSIFQDDVTACGLRYLGPGTLYSQYNMRKRPDFANREQTWGHVLNAPDTDEDLALRARLALQIASLLGHLEGEVVDVAAGVATPPETPRRTERRRTATQNPCTAYTLDDPAFGDTIDTANDANTVPETPRRTERQRIPAQNYDQLTAGEPVTPVRSKGVAHTNSAARNSYATPGPSTRKRPAALPSRQLDEDDSDDPLNGDDEDSPRAKRARPSQTVVAPRTPGTAVVRVTRTPAQPRNRTARRERATVLFHRLAGKPIMLTPDEYAEAMEDLVDVTEEQAHPHPPAFLSRVWDDRSNGINSSEGFVSGRFSHKLVASRGPPDCNRLEVIEDDRSRKTVLLTPFP